MRTRWTLALAIIFVTALHMPSYAGSLDADLPEIRQEGDRLWAGQGSVISRDGLQVLHLKGTPMEMGIQHGLLLGKAAERLRPFVDPSMQEHKGMEELAWRFRDFYMDAKLLPTFMRNIPSRYVEEMQGFVYGVSGGRDSDVKPVVVASVSQELALYMCTSVAAWGPMSVDGRLYHARNLDNSLPMEMIKSAVVMIVEPAGRLPYITLSYPANIGVLHAMNSKGISVSMNYSFATEATIDGIPFVFMLREVMERAETLEQAAQIVKESPRTIGLNVMISDAKIPQAIVIEASANHYAVRSTNTGFLFATNRYATEYMQARQQPGWLSSALRDSRFAELTQEFSGVVDPGFMAEILRDKFSTGSVAHNGMARGIDNAGTMASVIFDPGRQVMWVGVQDEEAPAPDRTLLAYSLADAIAGKDPRRVDLDLPMNPVDPAYQRDWLATYEVEKALERGDNAYALALLEPLVEARPQAEYLLRELAYTHLHLGQLDQADECFRRLMQLPAVAEPRRLQEATFYLGLLADKRGERGQALQWYQRSMDVKIPDLGGETERLRQLARSGLERPLGSEASLLSTWWNARVFSSGSGNGAGGGATRATGGRVAAISVYGAHRTKSDLLLRWLGVAIGQHVTVAQMQTMRKAVLDLGAFADATVTDVPIDQDSVHLIIRVQEGFGFYRDPVEFAVNTAVGLSEQTLSLRYENIGGRAINAGGSYGWGTAQQRTVYIETPVKTPLPMRLRLQADTRLAGVKASIGAWSGTKASLQRTSWQATLSKAISPTWTFNCSGQLFRDSIVSVESPQNYMPSDGQYALTSLGLSNRTGTASKGTQFSVTAGLLWKLSEVTQVHAGAQAAGNAEPGADMKPLLRLSAALDRKWTVNANTQLIAGLAAGYLDRETPLALQYKLGGSRMLRGHSSTLLTTSYAHTSLELRRYMRSDTHGALFTDAAMLDIDDNHRIMLWSPGVALRYLTPIGQTVQAMAAWAPTTKTWRYEAGFATIW